VAQQVFEDWMSVADRACAAISDRDALALRELR
jgi:hypothetical protein